MSEFQFDVEADTPRRREHEIVYTLAVVASGCDCLGIERSLAPEHQQVFPDYRYIYVKDIAQPVTLEFCRRCVQWLVERDGIDVTTLFVARRILAQCIRSKIDQFRTLARKSGFQKLLASPNVRVEKCEGSGFAFPLRGYAESIQSYAGAYQFRKHYYALPRDLKASGEEFRCAQAIDLHPAVKTWVRNVDRQAGSFWLPTSTDRFYPDFVVWLNDGRILLVEYKGQHLLSSDDTKEKRNVGALWAEKSDGMGAFMLVCETAPELSFERQMEVLAPTS